MFNIDADAAFKLVFLWAFLLSSGNIAGAFAGEPQGQPVPGDAGGQAETRPNDNKASPILRRPGKPYMVGTKSDDKEMQAAVEKARETLPDFLRTLRDHWPSQFDFQIKVRFRERDETELMWLSNVTYDGQVLKGKLHSHPEFAQGIRHGDSYTAAPEDVVDWTYQEYGRWVGAFTERVVRNRLPREEQTTHMPFAEPMPRRTVSFDNGRGRIKVPEIFETGVYPSSGKRWIAPRGKSSTISVYVSFLAKESGPTSENYGQRFIRAEAEKLGRDVISLGDKKILQTQIQDKVDGKLIAKVTFLVGWDSHVAEFSAQIAMAEKRQSTVDEFLLCIMDMIQSLEFVDESAKSAATVRDSPKAQTTDGLRAEVDAQPSTDGASTTSFEIRASLGATRIFLRAPANKARLASARVLIPDDVPISKARISGEGHNQDRVGYVRTMEVKINGRVLKVIPLIPRGQTRSFDMALPPGVVVNGWNEVQAYIEWSNDDYDQGHWVSLTLTLE